MRAVRDDDQCAQAQPHGHEDDFGFDHTRPHALRGRVQIGSRTASKRNSRANMHTDILNDDDDDDDDGNLDAKPITKTERFWNATRKLT